jgi:hypothetical protein
MAVEYALFRVDEGAPPLSEGPFIWLPKDELVGFVPDASTLSSLILGQPAEVESFGTVNCYNLSWDRIRGLIPCTVGHTFTLSGWRVGVFRIVDVNESPDELNVRNGDPTELNGHYVTRGSFTIRPDDVCIRDVDVQAFLNRLQSHEFISDLHKDGAFADDFPPYISGKLKEIIEANQVLWRKSDGLGPDDRERKRAATREYLSADFRSLCKKATSPDALVEFAAELCDPSTVPNTKRLNSLATPDMLALVTAAKVFWSPAYVENEKPETQPTREEVKTLLRFLGITTTNAASSGATVIRLEGAIDGKVGDKPSFFRPPHIRTSLRRPQS